MFNFQRRLCGTCISVVMALLLSGFCAAPLASEAIPPGIRVELNPEKPLWIRVTLRSGTEGSAKLLRYKLPWGNTYSMVLVAATAKGEPLKKFYPVDDPMFDEISVPPDATLTGDINLEHVIPDLRRWTAVSDVHLFWAYEAPKELNIPYWSGGWILIPKQK